MYSSRLTTVWYAFWSLSLVLLVTLFGLNKFLFYYSNWHSNPKIALFTQIWGRFTKNPIGECEFLFLIPCRENLKVKVSITIVKQKITLTKHVYEYWKSSRQWPKRLVNRDLYMTVPVTRVLYFSKKNTVFWGSENK